MFFSWLSDLHRVEEHILLLFEAVNLSETISTVSGNCRNLSLHITMLEFNFKDHIFMLFYASLAALPLWYLISYLNSPLRQYPGPIVAGELMHISKYHSIGQ